MQSYPKLILSLIINLIISHFIIFLILLILIVFIIIFRKQVWQKIKSNTILISILATFGIGLFGILLFCYLNKESVSDVSLSDWLSYFAGSATVGGLVYIFIDKLSSEKENRHVKWQSEIPYLSLASPCDPTLAYCDINILADISNQFGRGKEYFSIVNLGKLNAYDISIHFCYDQQFGSNVFYKHYIDHISPLQVFSGANIYMNQRTDPNGTTTYFPQSYQEFTYQFKDAIYSNYRVDPITKEISTNLFDLCNCTNSHTCTIVNPTTNEKQFYVRITYHSSYAKGWRYQIETLYKVYIECSQQSDPQNPGQFINSIVIKGIVLVSYESDFLKA
jgi:hypothetical protein